MLKIISILNTSCPGVTSTVLWYMDQTAKAIATSIPANISYSFNYISYSSNVLSMFTMVWWNISNANKVIFGICCSVVVFCCESDVVYSVIGVLMCWVLLVAYVSVIKVPGVVDYVSVAIC